MSSRKLVQPVSFRTPPTRSIRPDVTFSEVVRSFATFTQQHAEHSGLADPGDQHHLDQPADHRFWLGSWNVVSTERIC
jgi:hypothetical protein